MPTTSPHATRPVTRLALLALLGALCACSPDPGGTWRAATGADARSSAGAMGDRVAFTGPNGTAAAGGHTLQARDGRLSLDGEAYGKVGATAVSELQLQAGKARVLVDGQERGAGAAD